MLPKDTIFSNGPREISFAPLDNPTEFQPLGEVIADRLSYIPTEPTPMPTTGEFEFTTDGIEFDRDSIEKFLGCGIDRNVGTFSVIIQTEYINRPRNLKYPNKKRARRIWKKWRRRYGAYHPEQVVLPNCTMTPELRGDDVIYKIEAQ